MQYHPDFIEKLRLKLTEPLPGEEAQYRMAPSYRPRLNRESILALKPKVSGVMVLIYEKAGDFHLVFTQRKQYAGVHSGQMSFPGGKRDEADNSLLHTALRETHEEIGVEPAKIEVLGSLSELYIPPSNFLVYPTVGWAAETPVFNPQQEEVELVVEIPVSFFLDESNINLQTEIKLYDGMKIKAPAYIYKEHIIWGATAIMLSEFTWVVKKAIQN